MDGEMPANENSQTEQAQNVDAPVQVDWTKIDAKTIPAEVLKQHPEYQKVLSESIQRRKEKQELKKLLEEKDESETPAPDPKAPVKDKGEMPEPDPILEALKNWYIDRQYDQIVEGVAKKYNIPSEYYQNITGETEAELEASAANLAKLVVKSSAGNPGNSEDNEETKTNRMIKRMQDETKAIGGPSPFDPGVQRQKGGGTLFNG